MKHIRAYLYIIGVTLMVAVMAACSVSYKFNGASIDYKIGRASCRERV